MLDLGNEGNLLGHISIMNNRLDRVAEKLGVNDKECVLLLKHMVLAHPINNPLSKNGYWRQISSPTRAILME